MRSRWSARAPWRWRMYYSPCTPGRNCKPWETSRWPFRMPGPPRQRCKRLRIQFRNRARQFRVVFPTPQKKAHPSGSYLRPTLSPRAPLRVSQMFRGKHSLLATHRAIRDSLPAPRATVPIRVAPWRSRPTLPRPPRKLGCAPLNFLLAKIHGQLFVRPRRRILRARIAPFAIRLTTSSSARRLRQQSKYFVVAGIAIQNRRRSNRVCAHTLFAALVSNRVPICTWPIHNHPTLFCCT